MTDIDAFAVEGSGLDLGDVSDGRRLNLPDRPDANLGRQYPRAPILKLGFDRALHRRRRAVQRVDDIDIFFRNDRPAQFAAARELALVGIEGLVKVCEPHDPVMLRQAGIDALTKMMQPGMQVAAGHQQTIQDVLGQMMKTAGR